MINTRIVLFLFVITLQSLHANETNTTNTSRAQSFRLKRQSDDSCTLPPYPVNGQYAVEGASDARPGEKLRALQLVVTCYPGYRPTGQEVVYCAEGVWSSEMPRCVRHCRLEPDPSVRYRCSVSENGFDEGLRECNEFEPSGTTVKPECNQPNYYYTGVKTLMRCINGRWDHIVTCTADCGRITPDGKPLIIGGGKAQRGEFPWHAGIYLKPTVQGEMYQQICGGSIISTKVVISAAHCFWSRGHVRPASSVAVAVGKLYRKWNAPADDKAQKFDVKDIKIPVRYRDEATNYQDDIAAVTLSATIVYQPHVRPVCIDFDPVFDRTQLVPGAIGKVAGWGYTDKAGKPSPVLKVLEMPYVKVEQCIEESPQTFKQFITSDKICAGYLNGSAVCRGDSGGGLVFSTLDRGVERYYLRGIVSTAPKSDDDECNSYARASFTQVLVHATFIEENTVLFDSHVSNQQDSFNYPACVLPPYPRNGNYTLVGTPFAFPGQIFLSAQLEIKCKPGFIIERNVAPSCSYGRWSDDIPDCVRSCTLPEDNSSYRCYRNGEEYDCGQFEPSGVTAKVYCGGTLSDGVECVNGKWSAEFSCGPDCGRGNLIEGVEQPWIAVVYKRSGDDNLFRCGATIVKPSVVITAAHCMKAEIASYLIAAGVKNPSWKLTEEAEYRQSSEVAKIEIPEQFVGKSFDLAVVHLKKEFTFNSRVQPACLDLDFKYVPKTLNGLNGKTATWNHYWENSDYSTELENVEVRYMTIEECSRYLDNDRREAFLVFDVFCLKITAGQTCRGESGLGFVVPVTIQGSTRYILRGVFTTNFSRGNCDGGSPLGMTDIGLHTEFIRNNLECAECEQDVSDFAL